MKQIVNDEIKEIPWDLIKERRPTCKLKFRDVDHGRMILEQLWTSDLVGVEDVWIPVMMGGRKWTKAHSKKHTKQLMNGE